MEEENKQALSIIKTTFPKCNKKVPNWLLSDIKSTYEKYKKDYEKIISAHDAEKKAFIKVKKDTLRSVKIINNDYIRVKLKRGQQRARAENPQSTRLEILLFLSEQDDELGTTQEELKEVFEEKRHLVFGSAKTISEPIRLYKERGLIVKDKTRYKLSDNNFKCFINITKEIFNFNDVKIKIDYLSSSYFKRMVDKYQYELLKSRYAKQSKTQEDAQALDCFIEDFKDIEKILPNSLLYSLIVSSPTAIDLLIYDEDKLRMIRQLQKEKITLKNVPLSELIKTLEFIPLGGKPLPPIRKGTKRYEKFFEAFASELITCFIFDLIQYYGEKGVELSKEGKIVLDFLSKHNIGIGVLA